MLILTFQVNCASWHIPGIKEAIAMLLERWGDVRLVDVREAQRAAPEQMKIGNWPQIVDPKCGCHKAGRGS